MSPIDHDSIAPLDVPPATPTNAEIAQEFDQVPMFRQPAQRPGQAKHAFSPMEFFALSRVERQDVAYEADDALWLTEEPCPRISPEGIAVGGRMFYDEAIQPYVDTRTTIASRKLVIRYDRALLARGVLDEVRVYRVEPDGSYREVCRCRPRDAQRAEIDMHQVTRLHAQYVEVLLAKISNAEGELFNRAHGEAALAKYRDEQVARERRRRSEKPTARVAEPIRHKDRKEREREEAERQANAMANRIAQRTVADPDDDPPARPLVASPVPPEPSEHPGAESPVSSAVQAPALPAPNESLAQRLGGMVGFQSPVDDD